MYFADILLESPASDKFEKNVTSSLKNMGLTAVRPRTGGVSYSDLYVLKDKKKIWIEVKMDHHSNLTNPRVFYDGHEWKTTYASPVAQEAVKILNKSPQAKQFIEKLSKFSNIKNPVLPTTFTGLKQKNAVPFETMLEYFSQPNVNRYVVFEENYDLGGIVRKHYLEGKKEPAHYLQAGDDFYRLSDTNPLNLPNDIPLCEGEGTFKVRVSTRSQDKYYEIQVEIKIRDMNSSPYSIKQNTKKLNPFKENKEQKQQTYFKNIEIPNNIKPIKHNWKGYKFDLNKFTFNDAKILLQKMPTAISTAMTFKKEDPENKDKWNKMILMLKAIKKD